MGRLESSWGVLCCRGDRIVGILLERLTIRFPFVYETKDPLMAYNRAQAQKLCNATELDLFIASLADEVTRFTAAQLRSKIARARTLRDKNADLFRRQTVTTRTSTAAKRGNTGVANVRTEQKAALFGQVLNRFEQRLTKVENQMNKAAAKPVAATKSPTQAAVVRAPATPAPPKKSAAKRAALAETKTARSSPAKTPVLKKVSVQSAVAKALVSKSPGKPELPTRSAKDTSAVPAGRGPAVKRATEVSKAVQVRGKSIGAHARSANARGEAKRGSR